MGVEYDSGGVLAARGGAPRSKRRRQGSCGRVVRRRCVVLWRTGRRSQLAGKCTSKVRLWAHSRASSTIQVASSWLRAVEILARDGVANAANGR